MTKPEKVAVKTAKHFGKANYKENIVQIADDIKGIAEAVRVLDSSRLSRRAVLLLLADTTKIGMDKIGYVLNAAAQLDEIYLKKN